MTTTPRTHIYITEREFEGLISAAALLEAHLDDHPDWAPDNEALDRVIRRYQRAKNDPERYR